MVITRHNYEEFLILYLDNELDSRQRGEVEAFVEANPDVKAELELLLQSKLVPDDSISFAGKEELMRSANGVDSTNYEEWLLLYTDNELTAEQKTAVEDFATSHPVVLQELAVLQQTRLEPDTSIVFPGKESLYRKEEKVRRVIMMRWTRIAVAAILFFAVSLAVYFIATNKRGTIDPGIADVKPGKIDTVKPVRVNPGATEESIESVEPANNPVIKEKTQELNDIKKEAIKQKAPGNETLQSTGDERLIAQADPSRDNTSLLPGSRIERNMKDTISDESLTRPLTISNEINSVRYVTSGQFTTYNLSVDRNTQPADDIVEAEPQEKKNKLRGLFRKITRTIEKTTNLKTTDDEDRLLVAGLAIRL